MNPPASPPQERDSTIAYWLAGIISVGLLVYAELRAFVWDEGFHLVAAQMIANGKRPYLDFCFPQTPFNAYWNAALLRAFGHHWRVTHTFAALLTIATFFLVAQYLLSRFPVTRWRAACAIAGLVLLAFNCIVVEFGTIAQAYAMCLFTTFCAFRLSVNGALRKGPSLAFWSGIMAGAAAASSLLSAPVAAVLLVWTFLRSRAGNRWLKTLAFTTGAAVPFAPVFWLFAHGPYQTFFNVFQYQTLFRRVNWGDATSHDAEILSSWADSGQTLLLALLAIGGLVYVARKSGWEERIRSEFYLAAWISLALIASISTAHPTFSRYYVIAIPFIALLAAVGLYAAASSMNSTLNPLWPAAALGFILAVGLGHELFVDRNSATWKRYEDMAKKVAEVTPKEAKLFADEQVYFILNWTPPSGMEFSYSHKLTLSPQQQTLLHIIPQDRIKQQVQSGVYATLETCNDDLIDDWDLGRAFNHRADIADCYVFWEVNPEAHFERDVKKKKL